MQIHTGLFDHMVLQRDRRNKSHALITGETTVNTNAPVFAHVTLKNRGLPGFARKAVGQAQNGKFSATLAGLPVGGPYTIQLSVGDESLTLTDVLVGDVWIAAGQSNMHGCGVLAHAPKPHPLCRAFCVDDRWRIARDPINDIAFSVDAVHADLAGGKLPPPERNIGTGPAVAFIQEMHRATGIPQGVIASSHGGTSMAQWDPAKKSLGGKSLYGATLRRFHKNGAAVAGIIWYQGESETHPEAYAAYPQNMQTLAAAFRHDFAAPKLPIAIVQIARVVGWPERPEWNAIQDMQRLLPESIPHLAVVPAIDLPLDDGIHISAPAHHRLGKRLAGAMLSLLRHPHAGPPPITLRSWRVQNLPKRRFAFIILTFNNVVGELHAGSRPAGFVLLDEKQNNFIFDIQLEKNRAILCTDRAYLDVFGKQLFYGHGNDPYCNITDHADRSLPAFHLTLPAHPPQGKH